MTAAHDEFELLQQAVDEVFPVDKPEPFTPRAIVPPEGRDEHYLQRARRYCTVALENNARDLAAMLPDTGRNQKLNDAALLCYRYALAGHLDVDEVTEKLRYAGVDSGLGTGETEATLRSAWRGANKYGPDEPRIGVDVEGEPFGGLTVDPYTGEVAPDVPGMDAETLDKLVRAKLPLLDWRALWADQSEEEWIVEPILPARRLVALYSAPKVGKSLLLLELCVAIATGRDVLGVSIDRPRRVLYVDFENDPKADIRERLQAMGVGPDQLDNLCYLSFPTIAALDSEKGGRELMAAVMVYNCEVVVIDTVSRAIAGEENENDTWLSFYRHTGLAMKQAGVALIRLDHSGKDETKGQRGGSAKSGDVDAVWRLSRITDQTYRLDCEAARMPIAEKVLVLHREQAPLRHRVDAEGRSAAWRIKVNQVVASLDALEVPATAGRDVCRAALKAGGIKASQEVLTAVIKCRQPSENLSESETDRWS